jgi:acetyl-CoA synthetase
MERPAMMAVAVVPSPDAVRFSLPKTILILRAGVMADTAFAQDIFAFSRRTLARHKRIRRTEFAD